MMISNKRGFTLIELLVVVLIIGVLAAVALPQYRTAVNKSRYAGLMPLAKSVKDAEEEVFMTKADYTADLGDLAVSPGIINENNASTATQGDVVLNVVAGAEAGQDYVKAVDSRNEDNTFVMYFARSPRYGGEIHCEAKTSNAKAQQLCKSYGPVATVTGTDATFTTYVLQGSGADAGAIGGDSLNWVEEISEEDGPTGWMVAEDSNGTKHHLKCSSGGSIEDCPEGNLIGREKVITGGAQTVPVVGGGYEDFIETNILATCATFNNDYSCASYQEPLIENGCQLEAGCTTEYWRRCTDLDGTTCNAWTEWDY